MKRTLMGIVIGVICTLVIGGGIALAATEGGPWDNDAQNIGVKQENDNVYRLLTNQPAPQIQYSVERQNLIKRYKTYSDKNKISFIALTTNTGQVVFTGTIKGKVSSVSSQLTPADRMTCADTSDDSAECSTVQVAEPDGTWSTNGEGIFWFDSEDVYHEWNGTYLVADQPFTLTSAPLLSIAAEAK